VGVPFAGAHAHARLAREPRPPTATYRSWRTARHRSPGRRAAPRRRRATRTIERSSRRGPCDGVRRDVDTAYRLPGGARPLAPHLAHVRDTATVDNPLGLGHGEGIDGTTTCDRCGRRYEVTLYAVLELRAVIVSQCSCGEANATAKRPAPTLGRGDDGHGDAARPKTGQAMISRSEGRAGGGRRGRRPSASSPP
jgi:hypothetical protein